MKMNKWDRLWTIKFYRELGYDKKQIKDILTSKKLNRNDILEKQITELEQNMLDLLIYGHNKVL